MRTTELNAVCASRNVPRHNCIVIARELDVARVMRKSSASLHDAVAAFSRASATALAGTLSERELSFACLHWGGVPQTAYGTLACAS